MTPIAGAAVISTKATRPSILGIYRNNRSVGFVKTNLEAVMRFASLSCLFLGLAILSVGCERESASRDSATTVLLPKIRRPDPSLTPEAQRIFETNVSEELVLELSPRLRVMADRLQGQASDLTDLFSETIIYQGLEPFDFLAAVDSQSTDQNHPVFHISWPLNQSRDEVSVSPLEIWQPLLDEFQFEDTQFGVLQGKASETEDVFIMDVKFEGRFKDAQNHVCGVKAKQTVEWYPVAGNAWKIGKWSQKEFEIIGSPKPLFQNVTQTAIADEAVREALSRSKHEEILLDRFSSGSPQLIRDADPTPDHRYFSDWESSYQYPSVSVVDIDGDQWDDLFVTDRWEKAVLLRNNGNGSFDDVTAASGLDVEAFGNCAFFVDFDNDGDSDVLVGRTLEPSLFFRNENGKFVPDEEINEVLSDVKFVVSGSVADINRDGLLDIYLGTYCYTSGRLEDWIPKVVRESEELTFRMRIEKKSHGYLDRAGPPNVLLMNRGGKLERVPIDNTLKQWKNSYQSVWYDVDADGDQDLYVCNDFSPDVFFRNDTERGSFEPRFTEITDEVFPEGTMGFGMGANFGDYNSDGQLDLYVSNMYSKAGMRILEKIGGDVDPRIAVSARGNFLYENRDGKFYQVAGLEQDSQHVSKVGWSFGGQFADFNNDTKLDLYVPSGFYTAPKSIASQVDL